MCPWTVLPLVATATAAEPDALLAELVPQVAVEVAEVNGTPKAFRTLPKVVVTTHAEELPRLQVIAEELALPPDALAAWTQAQGLYTPHDDTVRLFWDRLPPVSTANDTFLQDVLRCLLAHELTHALQHRVGKGRTANTSEGQLLQFVWKEGHAYWTEGQVCATTPRAFSALNPSPGEARQLFPGHIILYVAPSIAVAQIVREEGATAVFQRTSGIGELSIPEVHLPFDMSTWPPESVIAASCPQDRPARDIRLVPSSAHWPYERPEDYDLRRMTRAWGSWRCGDDKVFMWQGSDPAKLAAWARWTQPMRAGRLRDVQLQWVHNPAGGRSVVAEWQDNGVVVYSPASNDDAGLAAAEASLRRLFDAKTAPLTAEPAHTGVVTLATEPIAAGQEVPLGSVRTVRVPAYLVPTNSLGPADIVGRQAATSYLPGDLLLSLGGAPPPIDLGDGPCARGLATCTHAWQVIADIPEGKTVEHADLGLVAVPAVLLSADAFRPGDSPQGQEARVSIPAGQLLRKGHLQK